MYTLFRHILNAEFQKITIHLYLVTQNIINFSLFSLNIRKIIDFIFVNSDEFRRSYNTI